MIALKGILTAKTAFMVGSGDDEGSDSDILRTGDGEVFIPGTSLAGICRSYLEESNKSIDIDNIFGTIKNKEEKESSIIFYDAFATEKVYTAVRDSVRLERRVSKSKCKFDYEIAEPKSTFDFRIEINYHDADVERKICETIVSGFQKENIRIGAKTTRGFGLFSLDNVKYLSLDLNEKEDMKRYIDFDWKDVKDDFKLIDGEEDEVYVSLESKLALESFIFIRDYATLDRVEPVKDSKFVDAKTLTNRFGDVIIPGTAWAGVFRHHIGKVLEKAGYENKTQFLDDLFGYQTKDDDLGKMKEVPKSKSNIFFTETMIKDEDIMMLNRTRTAVDRFSGSALQTGALFTGRVAYKKEESGSKPICLKIKIKKDFAELEFAKNLINICFKDIENGYLTVGGNASIGAGIFTSWRE